jgi:hypothetical protein
MRGIKVRGVWSSRGPFIQINLRKKIHQAEKKGAIFILDKTLGKLV